MREFGFEKVKVRLIENFKKRPTLKSQIEKSLIGPDRENKKCNLDFDLDIRCIPDAVMDDVSVWGELVVSILELIDNHVLSI